MCCTKPILFIYIAIILFVVHRDMAPNDSVSALNVTTKCNGAGGENELRQLRAQLNRITRKNRTGNKKLSNSIGRWVTNGAIGVIIALTIGNNFAQLLHLFSGLYGSRPKIPEWEKLANDPAFVKNYETFLREKQIKKRKELEGNRKNSETWLEKAKYFVIHYWFAWTSALMAIVIIGVVVSLKHRHRRPAGTGSDDDDSNESNSNNERPPVVIRLESDKMKELVDRLHGKRKKNTKTKTNTKAKKGQTMKQYHYQQQ